MSKARYIMKNRALGTMSHGQQRHEYVTYDMAGRELDRIECTPSTARWLWTGFGVEGISPARLSAIIAERRALESYLEKPLTERRKGDREKLARLVEALCADYGATTERREREKEIRVEITLGNARVGIDFDGGSFNSNPDVYCVPWNTVSGSDARFSPAFGRAVGAEVNPFHRRKCMGWGHGIENLLYRLGLALACIRDGEAFEARAGLVAA